MHWYAPWECRILPRAQATSENMKNGENCQTSSGSGASQRMSPPSAPTPTRSGSVTHSVCGPKTDGSEMSAPATAPGTYPPTRPETKAPSIPTSAAR